MFGPSGVPLQYLYGENTSSSIAYFDGTRQSIYTFALGTDSNLYANYGDGTNWSWLSLGPGFGLGLGGGVPGDVVYQPNSVTYLNVTQKGNNPPTESIYVFIVGDDNNYYACYSPAGGSDWQWIGLGPDPHLYGKIGWPGQWTATLLVSNELNGGVFSENIFVFTPIFPESGATSTLWIALNSSASLGPSAAWQWQDFGTPAEESPVRPVGGVIGAAASTEVEGGLGDVQMFVFIIDLYFHYWTIRWNGSEWKWFDQEQPSGV
jgi:hypothetical protein